MSRGDVSPAYSRKDLREYEESLLRRKKALMRAVQGLEDRARQQGSSAGDHSSVPVHLADLATDTFEQDMSLGRVENVSEEIKDIDDAVERIRDGTFGVCENCRGRIPEGRLRAIPWARFCIPCQTREEAA